MRYTCSENISEKINFKFAIFVKYLILPCVIYQLIEKNSGIFLVYCLIKSLVVIQSCHHFSYAAANHCCQSLSPSDTWQLFLEIQHLQANCYMCEWMTFPKILNLQNRSFISQNFNQTSILSASNQAVQEN